MESCKENRHEVDAARLPQPEHVEGVIAPGVEMLRYLGRAIRQNVYTCRAQDDEIAEAVNQVFSFTEDEVFYHTRSSNSLYMHRDILYLDILHTVH